MRYENMINFIAELRHMAFCRYVILCFSFLVDELSPPEVKKRVWVATHSRFSLYLRNENKYIKTDVSASTVLKKGYLTSCPRIVRAANDPRWKRDLKIWLLSRSESRTIRIYRGQSGSIALSTIHRDQSRYNVFL